MVISTPVQLITLILLILIFLFVVIGVYILLFQTIFGVPFVPSRSRRLMETLKKAQIRPSTHSKFIDLGSGDGRIVRAASRAGFEAYGVELNPYLYNFSRLWNLVSRNKAKYIFKNLHNLDLSEFDVVYAYLFPEPVAKLGQKLEQSPELAPKVLITNTFFIPGRNADLIIDDNYYFYKFSPDKL